MSEKSVTLSARLPAEDAEFLNSWQVEGADSSSEKLRKVVKDARIRALATQDYRGALRMFGQLFNPASEFIKESEREFGEHSELLTRVQEWLPEMSAYVHSAEGLTGQDNQQKLKRFEGGVAMRVMALMQSILQLSMTKTGSFYDDQILTTRIQPVLDLAQMINKNNKPAPLQPE